MGRPVFTLSCPDHGRTNGDLVAGTVNLDLDRAERKHVVALKVSLVCEAISATTISQLLTYESRLTSFTRNKTRQLLNQEKVVWKQFNTEQDIEEEITDSLDPTTDRDLDATTLASRSKLMIIPFLFRLPNTTPSLPPSSAFSTGTSTPVFNQPAASRTVTEPICRVRYYLRVEGQRKYWYLPKISVMCPFPVFANYTGSFVG